jgi:hypothetical protein
LEIGLQEDLSIASRFEVPAQAFEFVTELSVVVDLAVERKGAAAWDGHWLIRSVREVEDSQATEPKR